MQRTVGFFMIAASAYGATPVFARLASASGVDPISLLFLRFALAAFTRTRLPRGRPLAGLAALGAVGYVAQAFCYFSALTVAGALPAGWPRRRRPRSFTPCTSWPGRA